MKLSCSLDLAPIRDDANRKIDAAAEARARAIDPTPTLRAAVIREAERGMFALSIPEAEEYRRIDDALLALDAQRRQMRAAVAAATSEQDIRAILAAL